MRTRSDNISEKPLAKFWQILLCKALSIFSAFYVFFRLPEELVSCALSSPQTVKVDGLAPRMEATSSAPFVSWWDYDCHGAFEKREKAFPSSSRITGGTWTERRGGQRRSPAQSKRTAPPARRRPSGWRGGDAAEDWPAMAGLRAPPPAALSNGNLAAVRHRPSVGPDAARAGPAVRLRCGAQL